MLVHLMEGGGIPNPVHADGLPWNCDSFPEHLVSIAGRPFDADISTLFPMRPCVAR